MIRTKIVATMGPACASANDLLSLFNAGVNICRLNFSHGTLDAHLATLRNIREAAARHDKPIAILGDLCGPKIRLGKIADQEGTGGMPIAPGDELVIQRVVITGADRRVNSTYPQLIDDVQPGHRVLIEDGLIRLLCSDKTVNELRCNCTIGGILKTAKGINLPDSVVTVASITDRDWECADWAIENSLDYLALSFVRSADDLHLLREYLRNRQCDTQIIAKIEKAEALEHIDAIIEAADGLMIARGDLGVEMDMARVPIIQKELIRQCQTAGKPVIVATQMLQSMIEQASPTRAEVSDVANAIFDGTDAVMLSGETSVGKFPIGAVHVMAHIAETTEEYIVRQPKMSLADLKPSGLTLKMSAAVAHGVWQIVQELDAKLVAIWSQSGATARIFSKTRFPVPIIALSSDHRALRRMALHYGVVPQELPPPSDMRELVRTLDELVQKRQFASAGHRIVVVAGVAFGNPGTMNGIVIHTVGDIPEESVAARPLVEAVYR